MWGSDQDARCGGESVNPSMQASRQSDTDSESDELDTVLHIRYRRLVRLTSSFVIAPFVIGASLAFGMATGYAAFDRIAQFLAKPQS